MGTTINGDYLAESLTAITKKVREAAMMDFLLNDFFAGIDAGKTGIKIPFFMNYKSEAKRMIKQSESNGKYWELYERSNLSKCSL